MLRRTVGAGNNVVNVDCDVRVAIHELSGEEITTGISIGDAQVIMSPTPLLAAQWPGGASDAVTYPHAPWAPKQNDWIIVKATGRKRLIKAPPKLFAPTGEIVRIEMIVAG